MRLAAIYNVWDGCELLKGSMLSIKDHVDLIIIVYQDVSNFGEKYDPLPDMDIMDILEDTKIIFHKYILKVENGFSNETNKRNIGLQIARDNYCSHFLHLDCDEYYENFLEAKREYLEADKDGSVCKMFTYFKYPTLRFEQEDNYFVPFIHKIKPHSICGAKTFSYPYYVDPTRKVNEANISLLKTRMHHFSWVRKDIYSIERKIRNSSAKINIEKSQLLKDYYSEDCKAGFYVTDFRQKLIEVENKFNINI